MVAVGRPARPIGSARYGHQLAGFSPVTLGPIQSGAISINNLLTIQRPGRRMAQHIANATRGTTQHRRHPKRRFTILASLNKKLRPARRKIPENGGWDKGCRNFKGLSPRARHLGYDPMPARNFREVKP